MHYLLLIVACAFVANCAGGVVGRRATDRLNLAVGFSAGTVLAVAFFVFMPQAILGGGAAHAADELLLFVGVGFVIALLLDRFGYLWIAESGGHRSMREHHAQGVVNGAAIGVAYQVSPVVCGLAAAALLAHEFADCAAVTSELRGKRAGGILRTSSISMLCFAAGLIAACFLVASPGLISAELAIFGGYCIYLSASDLIPESRNAHPRWLTVGMTFGGAGALYFASYVFNR